MAYAAFAILVLGLSWRVIRWSLSPVPFRIPTVCGQQKSLPWIKSSRLESPHTTAGVVGRMLLEVFAFRSLFRNTSSRLEAGPRLIYREGGSLWLGAIAFHGSLAIILLRHLRLFIEPAPKLAILLDRLDGFFQIGAPPFYLTDAAILVALLYLLQRRFRDMRLRYLSLFTDYFALFLLLGVAVSGVWMRYFGRTDIVAVKQFAIGLDGFPARRPAKRRRLVLCPPDAGLGAGRLLPVQQAGARRRRLPQPDPQSGQQQSHEAAHQSVELPVKVHTYEEWEDEFRDKMMAAGLPWRSPNVRPQARRTGADRISAPARGLVGPEGRIPQGTFCYSALAKNLKYLGLPNPREWQPVRRDWKLPPDWKATILNGMKERLDKYRSFRLFMDICVRCGACADKCHFYIGSGDPKNMPVARAELIRSVYRRYFTAAGKLFGRWPARATSPKTSSRSGSTTSTSAPSAAAARSSAPTASIPPRSP